MNLPDELTPFTDTLQQTQGWMKDMKSALETNDPATAYRAMRASLHAIRDRITTDEAIQLGQHMPLPLLGVYFHGYKAANAPDATRRERDFLERVQAELNPNDTIDPRQAVEATLKVLTVHVPPGEMEQVRHMFHKELQGVWQEATA